MEYMKLAIDLAKQGRGYVNPNPLVGAVLVKDNLVIGQGYHKAYGGPHAEVHAIGNKRNLKGAALYVTLEPCCHYGKTPPCTDLIMKSGISKVIVATLDPNPLVAGKGVEILRKHGIQVEVGLLGDEARKMNEIFNHFISHKTPYVIMKYAMTLDGKISTLSGDSKWITGEKARRHVHETRHCVSGILVGIETIIADNPLLTTRIENGLSPRPIVLDSKGRIPLKSHVIRPGTILATSDISGEKLKLLEAKGVTVLITKRKNNRVDLSQLMVLLGQMNIDSILVEGGGSVHGSLMAEGLIHKVQAYIAPKLVGSGKSPATGYHVQLMSQALDLIDISYTNLEGDILVEGYMEDVCLQA